MKRRIIRIDEALCNGCGACAKACHEGAIAIKKGKARLMREDYCDGLGDCLPACPTGAICFEEREAPAYDGEAVQRAKDKKRENACLGCMGERPKAIAHEAAERTTASRLAQWPVQIKLAPQRAPYFNGAQLLIAADCTAYAYGAFHEDFIRGHVALIGCPKLDATDYSEKLAAIFCANDIRSVTVARMEVPCCGGIEQAVRRALAACKKAISLRVVTISTDGRVLGSVEN